MLSEAPNSTVLQKGATRLQELSGGARCFERTMKRLALSPALAVGFLISLPFSTQQDVTVPQGGCATSAAVTTVAGSGLKPEDGILVIDHNIKTKWKAKGKGESLWLELAAPTVIDAVAIAFRQGNKRVHTFSVYIVTPENQAELAFKGKSSGKTKHLQTFALGEKAQEAVAVTIVGYGNNKNKWNSYSEVELCTHEAPAEAVEPEVEVKIGTPQTGTENDVVELPFPAGRKGFNIVNKCSFPIRVGSTGSRATCSEGTSKDPASGLCFWALPKGKRDLGPGEAAQYVLPELGLKEGSLTWVGNIWASTGCTSKISGDYEGVFPSTPNCVTNYCPADGTCPDFSGPSGATTKAEFAMLEGGLDFYDVSIIDGSNIPLEIVPIDPIFHINAHYCGTPGSTEAFGELGGCHWKFSPENVDGHEGRDLSPYTRLVWPLDPNNPTGCLKDADCKERGYGTCGIYEERTNDAASLTGSAIPSVCGKAVGWIGGHNACGSRTKKGETFPAGFPYNCDLASRHGTIKQLIRCSGSVYSKQACYLLGAEDSCCGCPPWDIGNGGCLATNPDWTQSALPWANFFKSACPTAYSFPRDDRTSMFVCSNVDSSGDAKTSVMKNTQSYSIRFCPGDSEESFYG